MTDATVDLVGISATGHAAQLNLPLPTIWGNAWQQAGVGYSTSAFYGIGQNATVVDPIPAETNLSQRVREAGVMNAMQANIISNGAGFTTTLKNRQNLANGSMAVSIAPLTTGTFGDYTNSDTYAAGDLACLHITSGSGGGVCLPNFITTIFLGTLVTTAVYSSIASELNRNGFNQASATLFYPLFGMRDQDSVITNTNESYSAFLGRVTGTLSSYQEAVNVNTRTTATSFFDRINAANGTLAVSVGSGSTGLFEDAVHSDAISTGDQFNAAVTTGSDTHVMYTARTSVQFQPSGQGFDFGSAEITPVSLGDAGAGYRYLFGGLAEVSTIYIEAQAQIPMPYAADLGHMRANITGTSLTSTTVTFTSRVNGANGNQSFSVPAGTTGIYEDTTHGDTVAAGALVAIQNSRPGDTAVTLSWAGMTSNANNPVPPGPPDRAYFRIMDMV